MHTTIKLAIACDLSGFPLKNAIVDHYRENQFLNLIDHGIYDIEKPEPFTVQALKVVQSIQSGDTERGILVCGTGQGMAIMANKHKGIYACVADSIFSGERAKIINNANVLTLGGWITGTFLGVQIVAAWLAVKFTEKMEFKKEFLTDNFQFLQEIEEKNFK